MTLLYVTADAIGTETGGGKVTRCESQAMASIEDTEIWQLPDEPRPWGADSVASSRLEARPDFKPRRAHFYAGTFTRTIEILKARGTIVSYTAAAHDIAVSRREHERLGISFDYPHLTDPDQWARYVRGYLLADVVICPSTYSGGIMRGYGCEQIVITPHGCDPPAQIAPLPKRFVVGYLGQPGPDKGLIYLLRAWARWGAHRPDALLMIAGRGTLGILPWIREIGGGSFHVLGEVKRPSDLYDACTVYVQPSASEGFGCEVLEARAHGRPVICSRGAGARAHANVIVPACDDEQIANAIDQLHEVWQVDPERLVKLADSVPIAGCYSWGAMRVRYSGMFSA